MLSHAEPCVVFNLFKDVSHYASQASILIDRKLKLLFLEVTHRLHVPSIMRSLARNCTASCRDPDKMLQKCKDALPSGLLVQLKRALNHHNPTKFVGHITAEQLRQAHAYGKCASAVNNIPKVESTLRKEERNKYVAVFPWWLERFFQDLNLTPQGLICK